MTLLCLPHSESLNPPPSPIQCCLYVARGLWHQDTTLFWGEGVNRLTQQGQLKQNMAVARTFHTLTRIHHSLRVWMLILSDWDRSPCPFRPSSSIHVYFYEMKFNLVTDHKLDVIYGPCSKSCSCFDCWVIHLEPQPTLFHICWVETKRQIINT